MLEFIVFCLVIAALSSGGHSIAMERKLHNLEREKKGLPPITGWNRFVLGTQQILALVLLAVSFLVSPPVGVVYLFVMLFWMHRKGKTIGR